MAELHWGPADYGPLTFREVFLVYQQALENRWSYQAALLSEVHNVTVAAIRLNSRSRPKMTSPADFNPLGTPGKSGEILTQENFETTCKALGDCFLAGMQR